jgi:hypothetical protein
VLRVQNEYILWFNVSVDHIAFLKVDQGLNYLSDNKLSFTLVKPLFASQALEEITTWTVLKHCVNILLVVKVPVKAHDVWVLQSVLDFEFLLHLTKKIEFLQSLLHDYLEGHRLL